MFSSNKNSVGPAQPRPSATARSAPAPHPPKLRLAPSRWQYGQAVHATGWHNGGPPHDPAGYGLKFVGRDRDRYFDESWSNVILELEGAEAVSIQLSRSFWRSCTELRSADVGRWLLSQGAAPWLKGSPPGIVVTPDSDNRFKARVLRRRTLG